MAAAEAPSSKLGAKCGYFITVLRMFHTMIAVLGFPHDCPPTVVLAWLSVPGLKTVFGAMSITRTRPMMDPRPHSTSAPIVNVISRSRYPIKPDSFARALRQAHPVGSRGPNVRQKAISRSVRGSPPNNTMLYIKGG